MTQELFAILNHDKTVAFDPSLDTGDTGDTGIRANDTPDELTGEVRTHLLESARLKEEIAEHQVGLIVAAARLIAKALQSGGKVLLCGNGGSAADCQHMAAEFVSRLRRDFARPGLPAIALTTDTSFLTAFSNDCGFEGAFERQVQTLGQPGDVLIGISTSGNSANVVRAMEAAVKIGMTTIALTGCGGYLVDVAQMTIPVPHTNTLYIQEAHLAIEHILCSLVEQYLFGRRSGEAEPTGTEQITRFDVRGETP
jgi:phosphoheptose isomerase